jgi:Protein of unknown function (DUF3800)
MPTFIDESGDTGDPESGGKPYFRLATVWVPTQDVAGRFREEIKMLRLRLGLRPDYEFKFANTHHHPDRRTGFYSAALSVDFRFAFSSIDKTKPQWREAGRHELHWACATEISVSLRTVYHLMEKSRAERLREPIVVDNNEVGDYLEIIRQQFRGLKSCVRPDASMMGKIAFRNSASEEMLQLADMVCGACGCHTAESDTMWHEMISDRELH